MRLIEKESNDFLNSPIRHAVLSMYQDGHKLKVFELSKLHPFVVVTIKTFSERRLRDLYLISLLL